MNSKINLLDYLNKHGIEETINLLSKYDYLVDYTEEEKKDFGCVPYIFIELTFNDDEQIYEMTYKDIGDNKIENFIIHEDYHIYLDRSKLKENGLIKQIDDLLTAINKK